MSAYAFVQTKDGTEDGEEVSRLCAVRPVRLLSGELKDPADVTPGDMIPVPGLGYTLRVDRIDVTKAE